jgi:hypothetical protein
LSLCNRSFTVLDDGYKKFLQLDNQIFLYESSISLVDDDYLLSQANYFVGTTKIHDKLTMIALRISSG